MAETTTATWFPASTSRFTRIATLRMRSRAATEVPPNFITMRGIVSDRRSVGGSCHLLTHTYLRGAGGATMQQPRAVVSAEEVARFNALAATWWDPDGPMRPLHRMNPARIAWIAERTARKLGAMAGL